MSPLISNYYIQEIPIMVVHTSNLRRWGKKKTVLPEVGAGAPCLQEPMSNWNTRNPPKNCRSGNTSKKLSSHDLQSCSFWLPLLPFQEASCRFQHLPACLGQSKHWPRPPALGTPQTRPWASRDSLGGQWRGSCQFQSSFLPAIIQTHEQSE